MINVVRKEELHNQDKLTGRCNKEIDLNCKLCLGFLSISLVMFIIHC